MRKDNKNIKKNENLIQRIRSHFLGAKGNRRGFTMVELVVSLTLIVLVSAISIGVVSVTSRTYGETADMIEATNIAENAVECFRFAKNNNINIENEEKGFVVLMKNAGITLESVSDKPEGYTHGYIASVEDAVVTIYIKENTITITAENSSGVILERKSYTVR